MRFPTPAAVRTARIARKRRLTRFVVWLVPKAVVALADTVEISGDTPTDSLNRAVQIHGKIIQMAANGGGAIEFDLSDEWRCRVTIEIC